MKSKYLLCIVCIITLFFTGCNADKENQANIVTNLSEENINVNSDSQVDDNQSNESINEDTQIKSYTTDELLVMMSEKLEINKNDFEYKGEDYLGGYTYTYKMKEGDRGNPISYIVSPLSGNIYDEISEQSISNIFTDKKYIENEELEKHISDNFCGAGVKASMKSYEAGNVIISVYYSTEEKDFNLIKRLVVNPFTAEVYDNETKEFIGNLYEEQSEKITE